MTRLIDQYQMIWSKLKDGTIDAEKLAKASDQNTAGSRVLLSRLKKEHMAVAEERGEYRLVEPGKWIQIKGLFARNLPLPEELMDDLMASSREIRAIVLYGSRAGGNVTPLSDVDVLILSDKDITGLQDKYKFPASIEVQPSGGYDKILVKNAIKSGETVYDDGIIEKIKGDKTTKKDYLDKLETIRSPLFKLADEKLFESLTLMDISHVICSSLRGLEIIEDQLCGEVTGIKTGSHILEGAKEMHRLSKAGARGVPKITRKDLTMLRKALLDKWSCLKAEADRWDGKER